MPSSSDQSAPARRHHRLHERLGLRLEPGRVAIVQRERQALVLEQHARVVLREALEPGARRREGGKIGLGPHHARAEVAALQPMQAGCAKAQRREQVIELLERAAADQGQRAAGRLEKVREDPAQPVRHMDRARLPLDLDQRAVDIEEQGDLVDAAGLVARAAGRASALSSSRDAAGGRKVAIPLPAPTKSCNGPFPGYIWRRTADSATACGARRRSGTPIRGDALRSERMAMSSGYVVLAERGLVALRGDDARRLLQGVISSDIERVTPASASYGALLTPQGKYLFDFVILQLGDALLLDTERARVDDLVRRLLMYRLRAKVEIEDQSDVFEVAALLGDDIAARLDLPERPGAARALGDGVALIDPRLVQLGARAVLPRAARRGDSRGPRLRGLAACRLRAGEAGARCAGWQPRSGGRSLDPAGERLRGAARGRFQQGLLRRPGADRADEVSRPGAQAPDAGRVRGRAAGAGHAGPARRQGRGRDALGPVDGRGLALLRLEQVARAAADGAALLAGATEVIPQKPDWANF